MLLTDHKCGYNVNSLASPALSNHSDIARPQACCPNSALALGKVEAEGAQWLKAHSYPRIIYSCTWTF